MIRITVDIDIKNHEEIIRKKKGHVLSKLANIIPESHNLVENEVKKEVQNALKNALERELKKNGVSAKISVY